MTCVALASASLACSDGNGSPDHPGAQSSGGAGGEGGAAQAPPPDDYFPVALAEGLAPTPPMGWNSWNRFGCNINVTMIQPIADALVETGMADAGYECINIDDCWQEVDRGDLQWTYAANGIGPVERDQYNGATAPNDGDIITLGAQTYDKGLGVAGPSAILYRLGQNCSRFRAEIGIDAYTAGRGSVEFHVLVDGASVFDSGVMTADSAPQSVDVSVEGGQRLKLFVSNAFDGAGWDRRAVWADAQLECNEP